MANYKKNQAEDKINQEEQIRILQVVPKMFAAGIETFIMNMYRNIDKSKVQFDFLVHSKSREFFDDEIEKMGGKIFRLTYKDDKNIIKYIKDLKHFFKDHPEYKIVHGEMQSMMPLYLRIAKRNGVPIRIAHSHNSNYEKSLKGFILHLFSRFSKKYANVQFACSQNSSKYLFGHQDAEIIHNAINLEKFSYNEEVRNQIRNELGIENNLVIGHVGRFDYQKNHEFLIDIFNEVNKKNSNAVLLLIGKGKLESKIKSKVESYGLSENVKFLGVRKDVNKLYQAMDCFVLPSHYEGLPFVGIEAQITGLKCFFSDAITKETQITKNCKFLPINDPSIWEKEINNISQKSKRKTEYSKDYDLKEEAIKLQNKYFELLKGKK